MRCILKPYQRLVRINQTSRTNYFALECEAIKIVTRLLRLERNWVTFQCNFMNLCGFFLYEISAFSHLSNKLIKIPLCQIFCVDTFWFIILVFAHEGKFLLTFIESDVKLAEKVLPSLLSLLLMKVHQVKFTRVTHSKNVFLFHSRQNFETSHGTCYVSLY